MSIKEVKKKETTSKQSAPFLYEARELIKNAEATLGVQSYVAAGALNGVDKISIVDAEKCIQQFLKKGVK